MSQFFDLVGFEYKKIFKRKSALIALVLVTVVICFSPILNLLGTSYIDGQPSESHYEGMEKDRAYAMALSGRPIDETLLSEANVSVAEADAQFNQLEDTDRLAALAAYEQYARPYYPLWGITNSVYNSEAQIMGKLTDEDMRDFYQIRHDGIAAELRDMNISQASKEMLLRLDNEIETPFTFAYTGGYDALVGNLYTLGVIGAFALAICLAPMFAGEYSARTDQLILSSKWGKSKSLSAKIFTALTLCVLFFLLLAFLSRISCGIVYGYDGAESPFQLLMPFNAYPLTIAEALTIFAVCAFFGTLLTTVITLLLSAKFKSPFGVIIVVSILIFLPMVLNVKLSQAGPILYNLYALLPTNMMFIGEVFSHVPNQLFGTPILPYIFAPVFAAVMSIVLLLLTRRVFKNHQVG